MIPLKNQFVVGYYLISEHGDVYSFGDAPYRGTVNEKFSYDANIISACMQGSGIELYSADGIKYILSDNSLEEKIFDRRIIDIDHSSVGAIGLTENGECLNGDQVLYKLSSGMYKAISTCANGQDVICLTVEGEVVTNNNDMHQGDFITTSVTNATAVDIASSPWTNGYWMLDSIGGVFCFGEVDYFGSVPEDGRRCEATKIIPTPTGHGYWILDNRGMVLPFGDAYYYGHPKPGQIRGALVDMTVVVQPKSRSNQQFFDQLVENDMALLTDKPITEIREPIAP